MNYFHSHILNGNSSEYHIINYRNAYEIIITHMNYCVNSHNGLNELLS